ncbi:MAG: DUF808 domain-containing protein [Sphingomonas sp.]|uniref:DUF808 domain-containing protein n=1 Tax=Sphingomonas sp. TaxID=28214 RepID=UPI0025EEF67C|nr:DUF808 domain-containing protein [Sphingomonas sp.]MBX9881748.1 DUF808 domain-containing protein [Sphingomonas sp.]
MPGGLVALLDDVAAIAKLAAASLDDVAGAAGKAGAKAAGVVIDDTAVTPGYVVGLAPARELPIIGKIALGSLRNKLLFLLPAALLLSAFAPWGIMPLLLVGGSYLCFEGAEKLWEKISGHGHAEDAVAEITDPTELEQRQVSGAIRTDFILSGEIMAIALEAVAGQGIVAQAVSLVLVAIAITAGVYGVVALIVKMDDIGLALAARGSSARQALGRGLVKTMPVLLRWLAGIGTAAMLWVGGGIVIHALESFGVAEPGHSLHHWAGQAEYALPLGGAVNWAVYAAGSAVVGLTIGAVIVALLHLLPRREH